MLPTRCHLLRRLLIAPPPRLSPGPGFRSAFAWLPLGLWSVLLAGLLVGLIAPAWAAETNAACPPPANAEELLTRLQHCAFDYFRAEAHPKTGLVKDRAGNTRVDEYDVASLAATGFGLASLAVGVEHDWISRELARRQTLLTLQFVEDRLEHRHGWLYHFVNWQTGERAWRCECSSIDTALFLAGALLAGDYFGGEVQSRAERLYRRVDFGWMLTDGGARPEEKLLGHGWKPETGFLSARWDRYSEHLLLNLLALGSPTYPVPAACWEAWQRNPGQYGGCRTFACGPLFTHQYPQTFIDFRGRRDRSGYDYFETAVAATLANRQFCLDQAGRYATYGSNVWGLSACDAPDGGYQAYGAPPGEALHDGTVAPWATVAAVAFTPDLAKKALQEMAQRFPQLWGRYGFSSGFNLERRWFASDVIGIDLGAALLLIENHRSGLPWKHFMRLPQIQAALDRAGLQVVGGEAPVTQTRTVRAAETR